jgi:hypothetical protein
MTVKNDNVHESQKAAPEAGSDRSHRADAAPCRHRTLSTAISSELCNLRLCNLML